MEQYKLIGREAEKEVLAKALQSGEAELVAITGRRRVGKTFLVNSFYADRTVFEMTGVQNGDMGKQLLNFADQLNLIARPALPVKTPADWQEAFRVLRDFLLSLPRWGEEKRVVFFDELPWMATPRSGFLDAFGYFWNSWASRQPLVVVICGSAGSWMVQRVVNDRGGLHNRITRRIHLEPFTLPETEAFLHSRGIYFDRYQITQLYMAMGGVPHYLKEVDASKSAVQNIDTICFSKTGLLTDEFERLYPALFTNSEQHVAIIRALAQKKIGLTRNETAGLSKLPNGGGLTKVLDELVQSGFVNAYFAYSKKKREKLYRLTDEYSLFYLQFIEPHIHQGSETWQHLSQTGGYKAWAGYAFEGICLKHLPQIRKALGISGIYSIASVFHKRGTEEETGIQIDLVLDRNDHTINLFEVKFHNKPFVLTKEYAEKMRQILWSFQEATQTRKHLSWVFIASFGLAPNQHSLGLVSKVLTLDDLF